MNKSLKDYKKFDIIRSPLLTEKSNSLLEFNTYSFLVKKDAPKGAIKKAVEFLFNVEVASINTLIKKGKRKVFKGKVGFQSDTKKAFIKLKQGHSIDFGSGV